MKKLTEVYVLESWNEANECEIEGIFSTLCKAEAHEYKVANAYEEKGIYNYFCITQEFVDEHCESSLH